jgi:hypothetical protein
MRAQVTLCDAGLSLSGSVKLVFSDGVIASCRSVPTSMAVQLVPERHIVYATDINANGERRKALYIFNENDYHY